VPELPEVETVRLGLNQVTLGQPIQAIEVLLDRTIAAPTVADFLAQVTGLTIVQWHRRGKYLLAELTQGATVPYCPHPTPSPRAGEGLSGAALLTRWKSGVEDAIAEPARVELEDIALRASMTPPVEAASLSMLLSAQSTWLGVHLRMTGKFLWLDRDTPVEKHTRVRFFFADNRELRFVDQRTFGQMWWVPPDRAPPEIITGLQHLGPEPFTPDFSDAYFAQALKGRRRPIKNALLDQELVAGVGNIYADESLFLSKIHPTTLCTDLSKPKLKVLRTNVVQVLQDSVAARGTTFSDYRDISGVNGNYGGIAWVYARDGQPCRVCGTPIERLKLAGRSAHFCPHCQPSPRLK
jgi:formamidopyrimidine-DNA glycosylase